MSGGVVPTEVLDARGLRCPLPVIRLAAISRDLGAGAVIEVLTTDPAARVDIPAWCRMRGNRLVSQVDDVGHLVTRVELG